MKSDGLEGAFGDEVAYDDGDDGDADVLARGYDGGDDMKLEAVFVVYLVKIPLVRCATLYVVVPLQEVLVNVVGSHTDERQGIGGREVACDNYEEFSGP